MRVRQDLLLSHAVQNLKIKRKSQLPEYAKSIGMDLNFKLAISQMIII